jgi:hypothetical protein
MYTIDTSNRTTLEAMERIVNNFLIKYFKLYQIIFNNKQKLQV